MKKSLLILVLFVASLIVTRAQGVENTAYHLSMPEHDWCIALDVPTLELVNAGMSPSGNARNWEFRDAKKSIIMTIFFEKAPKSGTSADCRDYYFTRTKLSGAIDKGSAKMFTRNDFECVEYFYTAGGQVTDTKSHNMYLSRDGYWIDIHFSLTKYEPADSAKVAGILKGITVVNNYTDAIYDCFGFGSIYYTAGKYDIATTYYARALEAEKVKHRLGKDIWVALVDNLGMAYAMSGKIDKSLATFEYGKSVDPTYPNFHYNTACCYAEMGELDKAIESLTLAGKYKKNILTGEHAPNPLTDDSFKKYLKNEKFLKAVEEYNK